MEARKFLDALSVAERLKDVTRHSYTSGAGVRAWRSIRGG